MEYHERAVREPYLPSDGFQKTVYDFKEIIPSLQSRRIWLGNCKGEGSPILTDIMINFNGKGQSPGYDSFTMSRDPTMHEDYPQKLNRGWLPMDVETDSLAYTMAVQVCFIIAEHHMRGHIKVGSDGGSSSWNAARELVQSNLGDGNDFELSDLDFVCHDRAWFTGA